MSRFHGTRVPNVVRSAALAAGIAGASACGIGTMGTQAANPPVDWKSFEKASPSSSAGGTGAPKLPLADLEIHAMQKYVEAVLVRGGEKNAPIAPLLAPLYAPDAKLTIPGVYTDVTGAEAIGKAYEDLWGPIFPRSTFAPSKVFQSGGVLAFMWDLRGGLWEKDGARTWMGIGPLKDPSPVGFGGVTILWFNPDGSIRQDHTYFDVQTALDQLSDPQNLTQGVIGEFEKLQSKISPVESLDADIPAQMGIALNKKDEAGFLSFFATDVVHEGVSGVSEGVGPVKESYEQMTTAFPDLTAKYESFAAGDYVVSEVTYTGTQLGKVNDLEPTKKQATWHGATIYLMKDGKIEHEWDYTNRVELREQLKPAKPPAVKTASAAH